MNLECLGGALLQDPNTMAVGCLDGALKFFNAVGQPRSKDRNLGFDPLSLAYFSSGEYLAISGTDK